MVRQNMCVCVCVCVYVCVCVLQFQYLSQTIGTIREEEEECELIVRKFEDVCVFEQL